MSKINLGFIGTSQIAEDHLKVLLNFKIINLYGITSKTNKNSEYIKKKFKFYKVYKNYMDMVKDKKINALFIVVNPSQSYKVIKDIIKFKKPFFSEKPAGLTLKESSFLRKMYLRYKTPNMIGFNRRYYSNFANGLKLIKSAGKIRAINIEGHERFWLIKEKLNKKIIKKWAYANNIHMIDLLLFFGGNIKNIIVHKKSFDHQKNNYVSANFITSKSIIGNYTSYWNSPGGWSVKIYGNKRSVIFEPLENGYLIDNKFRKKDIKLNSYDKIYKPGFYLQIKDFINLLNNKHNSVPNLLTSYESMKICSKIYN